MLKIEKVLISLLLEINNYSPESEHCSKQFEKFPGTRYMGSKNKILYQIWDILKEYNFNSFCDAFSGSNVVGYFMKCHNKKVISNDFLTMSYHTANAIIKNTCVKLNNEDISLLINTKNNYNFITTTFKNLYFSDEDNNFLDRVRYNIDSLEDPFKKSIALSALGKACIKKRPRGIFTYVGHRYDDGRKDLQLSLKEHFINNIKLYNDSIFNNFELNESYNIHTQELNVNVDLIYFDPPYYSLKSDNDYVRRYHFVEGLMKNWEGLEIQTHTKTKKFKSYKSPFSNKNDAYIEFDKLFSKYKDSIIAVSYSSNSLPTKDEIKQLLKKYKKNVVVHEIDHTYSFGTQSHKIGNKNNKVKEYLFIGE